MKYRSKIRKVFFILLLSTSILTITGFLGRLSWILEMTSHFRVQYFFILIILTILFFFAKHKKLAVSSLTFALINLILIYPYWSTEKTDYINKIGVKGLLINLDIKNFSYKKVSSLITKSGADIIILEEFNKKWKLKLEKNLDKFPYSIVSPLNNGWSIGIFSRIPFRKENLGLLGTTSSPYAMVEFEWKNKIYTLLGAHLMDPTTKVRIDLRNQQLSSLAKIIKSLNKPIVLLGDLNLTPWSTHFQSFINETGLKDSRLGFGLYPTWPTKILPLQIPIDHSLVSPEIEIHSFNLGPNIGSDHFPVLIQFS